MMMRMRFFALLIGMFGTSTAVFSDDVVPVPKQRPTTVKQSPQGASATPPVPQRIYQSSCPVLLNKKITGKVIAPIDNNGCGERSPIKVRSIAGVRLSAPATLNCKMATALVDWMEQAKSHAKAHYNEALVEIQSSTSYQCRRRNNAPTGKISEHGFANAFDVIGFKLASGTVVSVLDNWLPAQTPAANFLRKTHASACNMFTTVLGPEANKHHADHFHMDLGCHGKNCTYLICE